MAYDASFSQRAAKGQAYNLAIQEAIAANKINDKEFIVGRFLLHMKFAALLQKADPTQLAIIIKNPTFLDLLKQLDEALD